MKAIVRQQDNFTYMKFQPGDGTIYTTLFGQMENDPDNLYIAIGPGDYISGGYFFRRSSAEEMANDMVNWMADDGQSLHTFLKEYHLTNYQATKIHASSSGEGNQWTVNVACLLAIVITLGDASNSEHLSFIGAVYNNDHHMVLDYLKEWGFILEPIGE